MAYLGNTLINGSLRCLNKAYFNDLSIGNDVEIAGKTTTNQLVISSDYNPSNLASANSSTTAIPLVIGNPTGVHIAMDADEIQFKNNATSNRAGYINYGGGRIYLSNGTKIYADNGVFKADSLGTSDSRIPNAYITTLDVTTGNITTLNASSTTTTNLVVNDTLKSFKWDISNVANLANDFMVAPTIEISSTGTVSISGLNTSTGACTLTFSDSTQITSDEFAGCKWYKGSKVRITVDLNGKLNSNIEGILSAHMNPTAGSLTISTTLENFLGLSNATGINASGATIMLYEVAESTSNETTHPVGIRMTAYGTNNSSYIDMYGGTASTDYTHPIVRIGRLNGITFNGKTFGTNALPAAWGIYTLNGYFEGAIVANEGKIGEWIIDSKKIYTGTWGSNNSAMMSPGTTSTDGNKSIGGSDSISGWTFTSGANFGVNKDGSLYANKGKIGGLTIDGNKLYTNGHSTYDSAKNGVYISTDYISFGNGGVTYFKNDGTGKIGTWVVGSNALTNGTWGANNSAMICTGSSTAKAIGGSDSISGWTFTSGANFGVNKDGSLYANKGKIGNWTIETDRLHIGDIGDTTSVVLSTGVTSTTDIGGSGTRTSENALTWVFTAGNKFGVTNNGVLYANDVNVTGAVNASTLHVGSSNSTNHLIYENNTIDLQTDWLKFDSATSTVTIGKTANVNDYNIVIKSSSSSDTSSSITLRKQDKELLTLSSSQLIMRDSSGSSNPFGYFTVVSGRDNVVYNKAQVEVVVDEAYNSSSRTYTLSEWDGLADTNKFYFTYGLKNSSYSYITSVTCNFVKGTTKSFTNYSIVCAYDGDSTITISSNDSSVTYGGLIYYTYDVSRTSPGYIIGRLLNQYGLGEYSVSTGYNNEVLGQYAFGAGYQNQVYGQGDHVVGTNNYSSGGNCHVEGRGNKATNSCCHAEGTSVKASGAYCHAEGSYTVASGSYSHSEGGDTVASGYASHAEGEYTVASAGYSHSEGRHTTASGECSHAQGRSTVASGGFSSASGYGTHAANSCQTVIGKYNIVTTSGSGNNITYDAGDYAFIIGNGSVSTTNRSNALTVDWNGRVNSINPNVSTTSTPSTDQWIPHYSMTDSTGYAYGVLQGDILANGKTGVTVQTQRLVSGTRYQNGMRLYLNSDGSPQVVVDHPEAWRNALGVNIKTYSTTITTNQYGEVTIPSTLSGKTILSVRCNNYQYGCFLAGSSIRVFKISATPLAWAVSTAIPFIFIYIQ